MKRHLSIVAVYLCLAVSSVPAAAQVNVPLQILSGSGTLDQFPNPPADPTENHNITSGSLEFDGQTYSYTMPQAGFTALGPVPGDPNSIYFESATPGQFVTSGGSIDLHYGRTDFGAPQTGIVTQSPTDTTSPDGNPNFNVTFLATFNPVPGSGTGIFENVIDGEFFMTAQMDEVDITTSDIPYSWSSDVGYLTVVPEPGSVILASLAFALVIAMRRFLIADSLIHSPTHQERQP